jgi:hypothetical protein
MRTVPRLCKFYPGICLTTEEKVQINLSPGSRKVQFGTMKTEYTEQNIRIQNRTEHAYLSEKLF